MNIKQLIAKRKALVEKCEGLTKTVETENRNFTADEKKNFDADMAEVRSLDAQIKDAEALIEARRSQEELETRSAEQPATLTHRSAPSSEQRDLNSYSFGNAIRSALSGQPLQGVEREMREEAIREMRSSGLSFTDSPNSVLIPQVVLERSYSADLARRDLTATGTTSVAGDQGGMTIPTNLGTVIDALRASLPLIGLGAQWLTGLTGNVTYPYFNTDDQAVIKAENAAAAESSPSFSTKSASPRRVPAFSEYSRQLVMQSSAGIEAMLRANLIAQISEAIQDYAINGTGSGEPYGILNTSGVGAVVGGTNGAALTWDHLIDLEAAVEGVNALTGRLGYLTNVKVKGKAKKTPIVSGTSGMIWDRMNSGAPLNDYATGISTLVPSNLTKGTASGVCSAIIFGNWADAMIHQWGGMELQVNPYSRDTEDLIRITARTYFDFIVRRAASFAVMKDVLTT